jgi:hypothetical protein
MISSSRALFSAVSSSLIRLDKTFHPKQHADFYLACLEERHYKINYQHYGLYQHMMQWNSSFTHPCYLQMITLPMQLKLLSLPESPVTPMGLVHIHNRIVQKPELEQGQPFNLKVKFGEVFAHKKGLAVEVVVTASQANQVVYEATSTYLKRLNKKHAVAFADTPHHLPYLRPSANLFRRELSDVHFPRLMGFDYAYTSGDFNPIHISAITARLFGFKRAIIHGMASLALTLGVEETALKFKKSDLPIEVACDFLKPVFIPATATILTGCIDKDRFITLHAKDNLDIVHLLIRYARGEAARLYKGFV